MTICSKVSLSASSASIKRPSLLTMGLSVESYRCGSVASILPAQSIPIRLSPGMESSEEVGSVPSASSAAIRGTTGVTTLSYSFLTNLEDCMNTRTRRAKRVAQNQQAAETSNPAPADQGIAAKAESTDTSRCFNPACKTVITDKNRYGSHGDRWTCCQACDDIVDPVSAEFRISRSGHDTPIIRGVDWGSATQRIEEEA